MSTTGKVTDTTDNMDYPGNESSNLPQYHPAGGYNTATSDDLARMAAMELPLRCSTSVVDQHGPQHQPYAMSSGHWANHSGPLPGQQQQQPHVNYLSLQERQQPPLQHPANYSGPQHLAPQQQTQRDYFRQNMTEIADSRFVKTDEKEDPVNDPFQSVFLTDEDFAVAQSIIANDQSTLNCERETAVSIPDDKPNPVQVVQNTSLTSVESMSVLSAGVTSNVNLQNAYASSSANFASTLPYVAVSKPVTVIEPVMRPTQVANASCGLPTSFVNTTPDFRSSSTGSDNSMRSSSASSPSDTADSWDLASMCTSHYVCQNALHQHLLSFNRGMHPFRCALCSINFTCIQEQYLHNQVKHPIGLVGPPVSAPEPVVEEPPAESLQPQSSTFKCQVCGKPHRSLQGVKMHMSRTHHIQYMGYSEEVTSPVCKSEPDTEQSTVPPRSASITSDSIVDISNSDDNCVGYDIPNLTLVTTSSGEFTCSVCYRSLSSVNELHEHECQLHGISTRDSSHITHSSPNDKTLMEQFGLKPVRICLERMDDRQIRELCDKQATATEASSYHTLVVRSDKGIRTCKPCNLTFKTMILLRKHQTNQHNVRFLYLCKYCGLKLNSSTLHKVHQQKCQGESGSSSTTHTVKPQQPVHMKTPSDPLTCTLCGYTVHSELGLKIHTTRLHGSGCKWQCNHAQCRRTFVSKEHLRQHQVESHSMEYSVTRQGSAEKLSTVTSHRCTICDKKFANSFSLKMHRIRAHGMVLKWQCNNCSKRFESKEELVEHKRVRHRFSCDKEKPSVSSSQTLKGPHTKWRRLPRTTCDNRVKNATATDELRGNGSGYNTQKQNDPVNQSPNTPSTKTLSGPSGLATKTTLFKCTICQKKLSTSLGLKMHRINSHGIKCKWRCNVCFKKFESKQELLQHKVDRHVSGSPSSKTTLYQCTRCSKKFKTNFALKLHKIHSHGIGYKWRCNICSHKFETKPELRQHEREQHTFGCDTPKPDDPVNREPRSPAARSPRKSPAGMTPPRSPNVCSICQYKSNSSNGLKIHKARQHGCVCKWKCTYAQCALKFESKKHRQEHEVEVHSAVRSGTKTANRSARDAQAPQSRIECNICGYKAYSFGGLKRHKVHKHGYVYNWKCTHLNCGLKFESKKLLLEHKEESHSTESSGNEYTSKQSPQSAKNQCPICGKRHRNPCELSYHMRRHSGERPFTCTLCNKAFYQNSLLRIHLRGIHQIDTSSNADILTLSSPSPRRRSATTTTAATSPSGQRQIRTATSPSGQRSSHTAMSPFGQMSTLTATSPTGQRSTRPATPPRRGPGRPRKEVYQCKLCNKSFASKSQLAGHIRFGHAKSGSTTTNATSQSGQRSTRTATCTSPSGQRSTRTARSPSVQNLSPALPATLRCDQCPRRFYCPNLLKAHLNTHRKYPCKICKKNFGRKPQLLMHMMAHRKSGGLNTKRTSVKEKGHGGGEMAGDEYNELRLRRGRPRKQVLYCSPCQVSLRRLAELRDHQSIHRITDIKTEPVEDQLAEEPPVVEPVLEPPAVRQEMEAPVTEPIVQPPVVEPVLQPPVVEPVIEPPVVEPVLQPPVVEPVLQPPVVEPVLQPPVVDPVLEPPVVDPVLEPPVVDPVLEPPVVDPVLETPVVDPVLEPPIVDPVLEPPDVDPVLEPLVVEPVLEPPVVDPVLEPPVVDPVLEPPVVEPVLEPPVVDPVLEPPVVDPVLEPPVVDPVLEPLVVEPVLEPPVVDPVLEPPVVEPVLEPPVVDPVLEPPVVDPVLEPPVVDPVLEPPVVDPVLQPPVVEPVLQPPVVEPVLQPPVVEPVLQPPVVEPVFEPPVGKQELEPPVVKQELQPPVVEPVLEAPVVEPVIEPPIFELIFESSVVEPVLETPVVEPVLKPSFVEPVIEPPAVEQELPFVVNLFNGTSETQSN